MANERYNVQAIAEVLLDELKKVQKQGDQIKEASEKIKTAVENAKQIELKVDTNSMGSFLSNLKSNIQDENYKLDQKIKENKLTYFPIYMTILFFGFGIIGGLGIYHGIKESRENTKLKQQNEALKIYYDFAQENPKTFEKYLKEVE
jgi:hypothetical protein